MKKPILFLLSLLLVLILAACGGVASGQSATTGAGDATSQDMETPQTPIEIQLILGTVKLDETEYAIDADQAAALLPLWKVFRSLGESETSAQVEIDAVVSQIQDTMTEDQIRTMEGMDLSMQDFAAVAEVLGIEMGFGGQFGDITPEMQATMEAMRESGQFPGRPDGDFPGGGFVEGGRMPGGGQGFGGGFEMDPDARATAIAERGGTRGARFGMNTALLDALIKFLEAKTQ